jgi:hypothetical protein
MNPRLILWLQRLFWILGWSVLVLAVVTLGFEAYYFFRPMSESIIQMPKREFFFLNQTRVLFSSLGQAFFAFLISSVFGMILQKAPVRMQQAGKFLRLACIGFIGEGILNLMGWARIGFVLPMELDVLTLLTYALSVFPVLNSFVYAITIYVLFKHFSQMVTFESEVV